MTGYGSYHRIYVESYIRLLLWIQSLSLYIFVSQDYKDLTYVIKHESGHVKQSKILGPLYLLVIGLPSIIHAALHHYVCKNPDYYHFYTERWANKLGGVAFL